MKTRIRIENLHVDLRGIDPALAGAVVPLLGPALREQLANVAGAARSAPRVHAGRIDAGRVAGTGDAAAIAQRVARQVVNATGKE